MRKMWYEGLRGGWPSRGGLVPYPQWNSGLQVCWMWWKPPSVG